MWFLFGVLPLSRTTQLDFNSSIESEMIDIPNIGAVFGVRIDELVYRAIRMNSEASCKFFSSWKIYP